MLDEVHAGLTDGNDLMFQPGQNEAVQIDEITGDMQGGDHTLARPVDQLVLSCGHAAQHHAAARADAALFDNHVAAAKMHRFGPDCAQPGNICVSEMIPLLQVTDEIFGDRHIAPPTGPNEIVNSHRPVQDSATKVNIHQSWCGRGHLRTGSAGPRRNRPQCLGKLGKALAGIRAFAGKEHVQRRLYPHRLVQPRV